jgi:LL-diaminopimelate aminotransferase
MQSRRLGQLRPYLFDQIDRLKESYFRAGKELLDLGIGDPDLGAPSILTDLLSAACKKREHHRYPPSRGLKMLIDAVRNWAGDFHGVKLDDDEIIITIGSKEAIGHLPLAVINPGDTVFVPDPGYPVYNSASIFADARVATFPLKKENDFWPEFSEIDLSGVNPGSLLFLNYPNNPTSAITDAERFQDAIDFCRRNDIIIANDSAYSEITYDQPAVTLFPLAKDAGVPYVEFFSFSKTFCITGWRVGFAIGSPEVIRALGRVKSNLDSGVFGAIQETMALAMENYFVDITERIRDIFRKRRDVLIDKLNKSDLSYHVPEATFYFWVEVPGNMKSIEFCKLLIEQTGIVATPGVGFGIYGEGYFRLSITSGVEVIREAGDRLGRLSFN